MSSDARGKTISAAPAASGALPTRRRRGAQAEPPPVAESFDLQQGSLGYALRRAQVRAYELYHAMVGGLELSPARMTALSIVGMEPDISQSMLAQRLGITGPSVLKVVDALEGAGLIARVGCATDRRRHALALTEAGRERLRALQRALPVFEQRLAQGLSEQERQQLLSLLERVATPDADTAS